MVSMAAPLATIMALWLGREESDGEEVERVKVLRIAKQACLSICHIVSIVSEVTDQFEHLLC